MINKINLVKRYSYALISIVSLLFVQVYFLTSSIFLTYGQLNTGLGLFSTMMFFLVFLIYLDSFRFSGGFKKSEFFIFIFIALAALSNFLINGLLNIWYVDDLMYQFIILGFTGIMVERIIYIFYLNHEIINVTPLLSIFMFIGVLMSLENYIVTGGIMGMGGSSYQSASYFSALVFGLLLFNITRSNTYTKVSLYLTLSLLTGFNVLVNGGRGGILLILIFSAIFIYLIINKRCIKRYTGLFIFLYMIIFSSLIGLVVDLDGVINGLLRFLEFILGPDGEVRLDLHNGSSSRDIVYTRSIEKITNNPLIGYGFFSYKTFAIQGHNFAIDMFLQFGIFIGALFTIVTIYVFYKSINLNNNFNILISFIAIYSIVYLTFSGWYLKDPIFWFLYSMIMRKIFYKPVKIGI